MEKSNRTTIREAQKCCNEIVIRSSDKELVKDVRTAVIAMIKSDRTSFSGHCFQDYTPSEAMAAFLVLSLSLSTLDRGTNETARIENCQASIAKIQLFLLVKQALFDVVHHVLSRRSHSFNVPSKKNKPGSPHKIPQNSNVQG